MVINYTATSAYLEGSRGVLNLMNIIHMVIMRNKFVMMMAVST